MLTVPKIGASPARSARRRPTLSVTTPRSQRGVPRVPTVGGVPPRNPRGRTSQAGGSNNGSRKNTFFERLKIEELFKLLLDDLLACVYGPTYMSMKNLGTSTIRVTIGNSLKSKLATIIETQFKFDKVLVLRTLANLNNITMIPYEYVGRKTLRSFTEPICIAMKRMTKNQLKINAVSTFINL